MHVQSGSIPKIISQMAAKSRDRQAFLDQKRQSFDQWRAKREPHLTPSDQDLIDEVLADYPIAQAKCLDILAFWAALVEERINDPSYRTPLRQARPQGPQAVAA